MSTKWSNTHQKFGSTCFKIFNVCLTILWTLGVCRVNRVFSKVLEWETKITQLIAFANAFMDYTSMNHVTKLYFVLKNCFNNKLQGIREEILDLFQKFLEIVSDSVIKWCVKMVSCNPLVFFFTPWKHQKASDFVIGCVIFSDGMERDSSM